MLRNENMINGLSMKKIVLGLLFLLFSSYGLAGCNTISGVGQDIESAGEGIHNAAEDSKLDNQ